MPLSDWLTPEPDGIAAIATESQSLRKPETIDAQGVQAPESQESQESQILANAVYKRRGMVRLLSASEGLPITENELADFYADDLASVGAGEYTQAQLREIIIDYLKNFTDRSP